MFKKMGFIFCTLMVLMLGTTTSISAKLDTPTKYSGPTPPDMMSYYIITRTYVANGNYEGNYHAEYFIYSFIYSNTPFIYDGDGFSLPIGSIYRTADYIYYNDKYKLNSLPGKDFTITEGNKLVYYTGSINSMPPGFETNHTIKNKDGSDFFTVPLLTVAQFLPILATTQGGMIVIIGSTIFLVALGISLVVLVRHLRRSGTF